jgi:cytochrome c553
MRDLMIITAICVPLLGVIMYVTADSPRQERVLGCYGECYEKYVETHGTVVEQLLAKQAEAQADEFSTIRPLWSGCAACHGQEGKGGVGPAIAGKEIADMLIAYRNRETRGPQSVMMWSQAAQLSDQDIQLLSKFTKEEL